MWFQSSANMVRWLHACFSPRSTGFDPRAVHMEFVVGKVAQGQLLSQNTFLRCRNHSIIAPLLIHFTASLRDWIL
jgi:hypothetical protein